jgi:hypothetical protein
MEPPQPAVAMSAALRGNSANFRSFTRELGDILGKSLSADIRNANGTVADGLGWLNTTPGTSPKMREVLRAQERTNGN